MGLRAKKVSSFSKKQWELWKKIQHCGYYHIALASTNIYNEKYEIYKTESNAKGRRDSKE